MSDLLNGPTKCLLVRPEFLDNTFYNFAMFQKMLGAKSSSPPLGLITIAAMLPKKWELRMIDEDVEPLCDADIEWADIVFVSGIGPQQETILNVVKRAHDAGKLAVVGGAAPTLQADVYRENGDFVICGEGENTVPQLLEDLGKGKTSGFYRSAGSADMSDPPVPRYDLVKLDKYLMVGLSATRGCPFACEFCAQIEIFGRDPRYKSPEHVIAELQAIYDLGFRGMIDFGFDNLIGDIPKAEKMLQAMADWGKAHRYPFTYSTELTQNVARQEKILALMRANDFRYAFIGIESGDEDVLEQTKKGQNVGTSSVDAVRKVQSYGISVNTGLILGFDAETEKSAANILTMVQNTGAFPSLVLPLHALPGTQLSRRLAEEGRLFGGAIEMDRADRTDTATTGLNFVTARPRVEILRDLANVLEQLYEPKNQYARLDLIADQLRPDYKHKPKLGEFFAMTMVFFRIVAKVGLNFRTGPSFWRTLFRTLFKNRAAIEVIVGQAAMHANYHEQIQSYVTAVREQIAEVESIGESEFNRRRLGQLEAENAAQAVAKPA